MTSDYEVRGTFLTTVTAESEDEARTVAAYIMDGELVSIMIQSAKIKLNPMSEAARWGKPI